jgi:hypothetical protein
MIELQRRDGLHVPSWRNSKSDTRGLRTKRWRQSRDEVDEKDEMQLSQLRELRTNALLEQRWGAVKMLSAELYEITGNHGYTAWAPK